LPSSYRSHTKKEKKKRGKKKKKTPAAPTTGIEGLSLAEIFPPRSARRKREGKEKVSSYPADARVHPRSSAIPSSPWLGFLDITEKRRGKNHWNGGQLGLAEK